MVKKNYDIIYKFSSKIIIKVNVVLPFYKIQCKFVLNPIKLLKFSFKPACISIVSIVY